jgi:flagellar biosynthetic protein FlhB
MGKAFVAIAVLGAIAYALVGDLMSKGATLALMPPADAAITGWTRLMRLMWQSGIALLTIAGFDYGIQRWRTMSSLKMTKQEVKDEHKMQEGNPQVKARVRRMQRDMTRRRMLKAVQTATVVVTNPTHYAVALEYDRSRMAAPVVVAKGADHIAARIKKVARDHGVPIVENVPLAQGLYKGAEIGDTIPAALFGAVAEVLAYLVRIKQLML